MTTAEIIRHFAWARQVHLDWARHQDRLRRAGKPPVKHVGSAPHHRKWVKIYDEAIRLLEAFPKK